MSLTEKSGNEGLFTPDELKIVYNSLNGKGDTIASGREITTKHIRRALSRAFKYNSTKIISEIQKNIEKKKLSEKEIHILRYTLIGQLEKKYNIKTSFVTFEDITKDDDETFIKKISEEIYPQIKKDTAQSHRNSSETMKFRKGDDIEMNRKANDQYNISKAGSRGKIVGVNSNNYYHVEFSYFPEPGNRVPQTFEIHKDYMMLMTPRTLEDFSAMVRMSLKENIDISITKKEIRKYEEKYETLGLEKLIAEGMFLPVDKKHYALNFGEVTKFVAPKLHAMYSDPTLYSSAVMFEPPAERQPNVLRLQLTDGCDHNKCTYCNGFNGIKHCQKTKEEFIQHTDKVLSSLDGYKGEINRVFIGSGNGLDVDQETLKACVQYVNRKLNLKRIAIYANTKSILSKTRRELRALRESGLSCIYRGAETGSDGVLQYVNKGCTFEEMLKAGEMINDANMDLSVMLMPGLGGKRYSEEHVKGIITLLNSVRFKFITLMAINPPEESRYKKIMAKEIAEGNNRPLTDVEIVEQVREIIKNTYPNGQKIGMYGKEIDIVGSNPINFSETLYDDGKREIIKTCNNYIKDNQ